MNTSKEEFLAYFDLLKKTIDAIDIPSLEKMVDILMECRENENFTYIFGNGGSAANASHIAGDFLKGISYGMDKRFKMLCLNDNMAATTAITNDLSYDEVFIEQLMTFMKPGDVVIGISGSGNSTNVVKAIEWAGKNGATTIGMVGYKGGKLKEIAHHVVHIPVADMEITEDMHTMVYHAIKQQLIKRIKGESNTMGAAYDARVQQ